MLTPAPKTSSLFGMRFAKWGFLWTLTVALAAYGFDCVGMHTPEEAMQCCDTMRCHSQHHNGHRSEDCCKSMVQTDADLGPPPALQGISFSPVVVGVLLASNYPHVVDASVGVIAEHSHDPPPCCSTSVLSLRI